MSFKRKHLPLLRSLSTSGGAHRDPSQQSSSERVNGKSASPSRGSSESGRFIASSLPFAIVNIQQRDPSQQSSIEKDDKFTEIAIKPQFRLPHFRWTSQITGGAFILKRIFHFEDKPPYINSAVYPPHLVGSPYLGSTHQGSSKAFVSKKTSSDKTSYIFSAAYPPCLLAPPQFGPAHQGTSEAFVLKRISLDNPSYIFWMVYPPRPLRTNTDFGSKRITSDKPPTSEKRFRTDTKIAPITTF